MLKLASARNQTKWLIAQYSFRALILHMNNHCKITRYNLNTIVGFEIPVKISQQGTLVEHNMFDEDEHFHQLKVENSQSVLILLV